LEIGLLYVSVMMQWVFRMSAALERIDMSGDHNQYQKPDKCQRCGEVNPAYIHTCTPMQHWSDCAVHSEPAYPAGECDCGGVQPEQEPVAWADKFDIDREGQDLWVSRQKPAKDGVPLYTAPPQREWHGLTDEEKEHYRKLGLVGVEIIETILKEKNYDKR
jgi:hypothetical protein